MPDRYLYLLLDLVAISIPLICSFYRKASFAKTFDSIWPAIFVPLVPFVLWDVVFTQWGHWGFNERYLVGLPILGLPIEEWLFFICIPYACLFTYFAFKVMLPVRWVGIHYLSGMLGVFVLGVGVLNFGKDYTFLTGVFLGGYLLFLSWKRSSFLTQFFLSYTITLIPFFLINGVLTGSWIQDEVVWYNNLENMATRLGTIPIEDPFYGMLLLLLNVHIWEHLTSAKRS